MAAGAHRAQRDQALHLGVDEPHLVEACRGQEVGSGQREIKLEVPVRFDQWGRRRLGCGKRRKASRRDRLTVTPAGDGHGHDADHGRGRTRRRDQCPPEHLARPDRPDRRCHRGCDPRTPPPRRAHRRHPPRGDRAAVPAELPGVLGRGPHSHPSGQRATSPPRPVGGSGPVDRGRTVQVFEDADAPVCPVLKHWRGPEHPGRCETRWGRRRCQLAVAVPKLDDARPRVGQVRWADRSGGPVERNFEDAGRGGVDHHPVEVGRSVAPASASPTADTTAWPGRSRSGRAPP